MGESRGLHQSGLLTANNKRLSDWFKKKMRINEWITSSTENSPKSQKARSGYMQPGAAPNPVALDTGKCTPVPQEDRTHPRPCFTKPQFCSSLHFPFYSRGSDWRSQRHMTASSSKGGWEDAPGEAGTAPWEPLQTLGGHPEGVRHCSQSSPAGGRIEILERPD